MKTEVVSLIQKNLLEIIPELEGEQISYDETLVNLWRKLYR
jgi:hypothetical protein